MEPSTPSRSTATAPPVREFAMTFTSTPRGARLARLLVARCLDTWGYPYDGEVNQDVVLIAAELCANAVRHGRVSGRDFHVRLTMEPDGGQHLRLEVSDTRTERRPDDAGAPQPPDPGSESGRGLVLVAALAVAWGVRRRRAGGPGKTVWAVYTAAQRRSREPGAAQTPSPVRP
ncbi:ATP-binding protein [Streptomyces sp. NPDC050418]|uniref:ATP-binding protein n=1 Tax=Streptomyces sp. NPDC050418 TaxID=3365612 RepID=UPI0037A59D12